MSDTGALLCAKYAVQPNFFGYCGPEKNKNLRDHLVEMKEDGEVQHLLSQFETLYPYLSMIAQKNNISDCFDPRVVEAYWIGNSLLHNFTSREYTQFLKEKLTLEHSLSHNELSTLMTHLADIAPIPFHTFHVLHIFKRTGKIQSPHSLPTIESCRIRWGKIIGWKNATTMKVVSPRITIINDTLQMHDNETVLVSSVCKNQAVVTRPAIGDWISFHWGIICDTLTPTHVRKLEYYTSIALSYL